MNKRTFIKNSALIAGGLAISPKILFSNSTNSNDIKMKNGEFILPILPYSYNAFTDVIDEKTMEIHYSKHHQGYVNKLNKAVKDSYLHTSSLEEILKAKDLPSAVRNNGGGHYNHSLYWDILTPGGKSISNNFEKMIVRDFGSIESLLNKIADNGKSRFGSGWVWLVQTNDNKLVVTSTPNQDNPLMQASDIQGNPLLGIDVWEHAYYLKYQNKRADYLQNILKIIDWSKVEKRIQ